jgi:carbon-monoxide dehydrogenase small subunit
MKVPIKITVNGEPYEITIEPRRTLVEVLRDDLGLTGTKYGCGSGECGSCTVLVDGKAVLSCLTLAVAVEGKQIITIEGLVRDRKLHPIQEMFAKHVAFQCGMCTPGMIMSAKALLDEKDNPSEEDVREHLKGNLCRCTGYVKPVEAVLEAAEVLRGEKTDE